MKIVQVYHRKAFAEPTSALELVAEVSVAADAADDAALDAAYEQTQNIAGSWSKGPILDGEMVNEDWSPSVSVKAPLPVHGGKQFGLRSSGIADVFVIAGQAWKVKSFGFEACEVPA